MIAQSKKARPFFNSIEIWEGFGEVQGIRTKTEKRKEGGGKKGTGSGRKGGEKRILPASSR